MPPGRWPAGALRSSPARGRLAAQIPAGQGAAGSQRLPMLLLPSPSSVPSLLLPLTPIPSDFALMSALASLLEWVPGMSWLNLESSLEQFSGTMARQVDLQCEADHLTRFNHFFWGRQVRAHRS